MKQIITRKQFKQLSTSNRVLINEWQRDNGYDVYEYPNIGQMIHFLGIDIINIECSIGGLCDYLFCLLKENLRILEKTVEDVKPKKEFKVGDKVKVVDLEYRDGDEYLNAIGRIIKIDDDKYPYRINFDNEELNSDWFKEHQLKIIEDEEEFITIGWNVYEILKKMEKSTGYSFKFKNVGVSSKGKEIIIKGKN